MRSSLLVEFASDDQLLAAARHMRALGYGDLEAYSPFPVAGIDEALGAPSLAHPPRRPDRRTHRPRRLLCHPMGHHLDYPLRVGGFPLNSLPAFIPIMFETTILAGALTAFCAVIRPFRTPAVVAPA
jgi:hypothetical protein